MPVHADRIRAYATSILTSAEEGTLESYSPGSSGLESVVDSMLEGVPSVDGVREDVTRALDHLRTGQDLTPRDSEVFEAIILPKTRPVADVSKGVVVKLPRGEFSPIVSDAKTKKRVEAAIASVGCILVPEDPGRPYAGTGFLVGPGLVMTNRHVAQIFSQGLGTKRLSFVRGQKAAFTPLRETEQSDSDPTYRVRKVKMVHPYWDMALLEVPELPGEPLSLSPLESQRPTMVAVIGYPALDPRNNADVQNKVFGGKFYVKRLAPGYVNGRRKVSSFDNQVNAATHDASTLGGNSGSAVVDVATGHVVALHFAGKYLDTNYAVPVAELARDARVIDAGVQFTESARARNLAWEKSWSEADEESVMSAVSPPSASVSAPVAMRAEISATGTSAATSSATTASFRITIPIELTVTVRRVDVKD